MTRATTEDVSVMEAVAAQRRELATLLGVIVLNEHLGVGGVLAFALILLGSWLSTRGKPRTVSV